MSQKQAASLSVLINVSDMKPAELTTDAIDTFMGQALALATSAIGLTDPNPRVGCVITDATGHVIGSGHTQQAGGPHAEVMALRDAAARGESVVGATAYVTLEPCAHYGRTPPCCDALVSAKVGRVVIALSDNNPQVAGQGAARLRQAGIEVIELPPGPLPTAAYELNIGFFSRMQRGRPWVRLKAAVSLDGKTALQNGVSQWITGEAARIDGHAWRKRAGAVLTGIGTVLGDDPRLDVRHVSTPHQPLRVILDSQLRTPPDAAILKPPGRALIYCTRPDAERRAALEAMGAEVAQLPEANRRLDLSAVLLDLGRRGINELHIEAGQDLNGAFVSAGLVDEFLYYVAPLILGPGRELAALDPLARLEDGLSLEFHSVQQLGPDLRIIARRLTSARADKTSSSPL